MNLIVQPPANADFMAALVWLVIRRHYRRAQQLNDAWETALEDIEAMPCRFSPVENAPPGREFREYFITRLQYRVVFEIVGQEIRVLALVHARQHDRHWINRLTP